MSTPDVKPLRSYETKRLERLADMAQLLVSSFDHEKQKFQIVLFHMINIAMCKSHFFITE